MPEDLSSEGDLNLTPRRRRWEEEHLAPATRALAIVDQSIEEAARG